MLIDFSEHYAMTTSRRQSARLAEKREIKRSRTNGRISTGETRTRQLSPSRKGQEMDDEALILIFGAAIATAIGILAITYASFPELKPEEREHFKFPRSLEDAKELGRILSAYKNDHFVNVFIGVAVVYVLLQSFMIPGSIFLSILSGYLFPFPVALLLICTCSACGASGCYLLSSLVGRKLMRKYFAERLAGWKAQISKRKSDLLSYIVFLRITPFFPNWFINLASPVLDVPFSPFFWGTFIGVAPPSLFFIRVGTTLEKATHSDVAFSWTNALFLAGAAIISILPIVCKNYIAPRFAPANDETTEENSQNRQ